MNLMADRNQSHISNSFGRIKTPPNFFHIRIDVKALFTVLCSPYDVPIVINMIYYPVINNLDYILASVPRRGCLRKWVRCC